METRRGTVLVKAVAGVLGLGIAGIAAHHLSGGACRFGSCHADQAGPAVGTVSLGSRGCPMGGGGCTAGQTRIATTEADYFEDAATGDVLAGACDLSSVEAGCPMKDGQKPEAADAEKIAASGGK